MPCVSHERKIMKRAVVTCFLILLVGCQTLEHPTEKNPFKTFTLDKIARVVICKEEIIYGLHPTNISEDSVFGVNFYLKPTGVTIRDKNIIAQLYNAGREADVSFGYPKTPSGLLSTLVFLDKRNRVLAVTSVENHQCCVSLRDCSMEEGWIKFNKNWSLNGFQSVPFCRTIFEFMKKEMPQDIEYWNKEFRNHGGIEKLLFGDMK